MVGRRHASQADVAQSLSGLLPTLGALRVQVRMSGAAPDDQDPLLERCRQGDQVAFGQLFARHAPDVTRLVARMVGRRAEVDDLVQEVFLQVHRSLREFRGDARFSTWLHRVTVNVVLMARRAAGSRPVFAEPPPGDFAQDDGLWPDEDAARRERLRALQRCLDQLSDKKRVVFVLSELEGMPAAEIAAIVEAPVLTVRTRLFYARQELTELMKREPSLSALASDGESGQDSERTGGPTPPTNAATRSTPGGGVSRP
ncbi:MAG: RNA polymerase sigma factor [Myxococcales bacterium]|nr:MAG: RNA polymerase sigma factor [Myxococcales bacterium]